MKEQLSKIQLKAIAYRIVSVFDRPINEKQHRKHQKELGLKFPTDVYQYTGNRIDEISSMLVDEILHEIDELK